MAKYKFSDPSGGSGDFLTTKGLYTARIKSAKAGESKGGAPQIVVTFEVTRGDQKGKIVQEYLTLIPAAEWRVIDFLNALDLMKSEIDTDLIARKCIGKVLLIDVQIREYEGQDRADVKRFLPNKAKDLDPELADDPDLNDEEPDDEEEEDEEDLDEEEEDGLDRDEIEAELGEMSRSELRKYLKENELDVRVTKAKSDQDLVEEILDALGLNDDEEEEDDEGEEVDYSELSLAELKAALKERGLSATGKKDALIERLEEDDDSEDPFGE